MPSTRKPTFRAGKAPGGGGQGGGNGGHARGHLAEGVISAERQVDDRQPGESKTTTAGRHRPAAGNVVAFPEPKGRRTRRNFLWTACITAVLVAGLIAAAIWSPALAVRTVTVTGTKLLTPDAVKAALEPVKGTPLPQVSKDRIEGLVKPLVQIRSVSTEAHPPSELVVRVTERVPVALVKQGADYLLVDVDGVQLDLTKDPAAVALPLIDGGSTAADKELFAAITAVLATLPPDVLAQMATASAKSVDSVELKLTNGKTVVWGNATDKELKAKVLEALLKKPVDPKIPVSVYDVSTPRHPFTK